jgi:flavin-binding protein dodecin
VIHGNQASSSASPISSPTRRVRRGGFRSVAKVSEISATSTKNFEDALSQGLVRASKTLRHIKGAWIKEQHIRCDESGKVIEYQVNMMVTFVLDD